MVAETHLASIETALADIVERLDRVERIIAQNGGPLLDDGEDDRRMSKPELARRWDVSTRSVDRAREKDPEFPRGEQDYASGPVYFWLRAIVRYERKRALRTEQLRIPKRTLEVARAALREQRSEVEGT